MSQNWSASRMQTQSRRDDVLNLGHVIFELSSASVFIRLNVLYLIFRLRAAWEQKPFCKFPPKKISNFLIFRICSNHVDATWIRNKARIQWRSYNRFWKIVKKHLTQLWVLNLKWKEYFIIYKKAGNTT